VSNEKFERLWAAARAAAAAAAAREQDAEMRLPESRRGFDCGFAWLTMPGNTAFARWAKAKGIASKRWPTGYQVWYSHLHDLNTQSISVHEAAVRAAHAVLADGLGPDADVGFSSRLD
jgi:hypothetical protein